ncbi:hypothetical protein [Yersinia phage fEV-1]|nr:hypothetical protein [Yersinia phage fEV-1]
MNIFLTVRMDKKALEAFKTHCTEKLERRHSDVVRELVTATTEGRVKITPTESQKEIYK